MRLNPVGVAPIGTVFLGESVGPEIKQTEVFMLMRMTMTLTKAITTKLC